MALSAYNNATKRHNLFNQTDLTYTLSTGKIRHTLLGGMELGRQSTDNFRNTGFFNNTATSIQVPYSNPTISTPVTFPSKRDRRQQSPADKCCSHLCPGSSGSFALCGVTRGRSLRLL